MKFYAHTLSDGTGRTLYSFASEGENPPRQETEDQFRAKNGRKFSADDLADIQKGWQPLEEHLQQDALLATGFVRCIGLDTAVTALGWLHDLGKYNPEFQRYLRGLRGKGEDTRHAMHGAALLYNLSDCALVQAIAGRHAGLYDWSNLDTTALDFAKKPGCLSMATLSRVLRRHGLQRLSALEPPRPPPVRYESPAPGGLLHLDIKKLGRFNQPGVRATGQRHSRNPGAGVESLHVAIDDHSRVAFACLHPDEKRPSVLDALRQAITFYAAQGVAIERVLTDRGASYRSKLFAQTCREPGLKPLFTRPYRPQTNGKAERFIQTVTREWAYARAYDSSDPRAALLPSFLHDYNFHRPPSALGHQPPASRLPKTADNLLTYNS